jgi:hypothetical protein
LLRAVVKVSLEPAPLCVAGLDDARPRSPQIFELRADLRLKPFVLDCHRRGRDGLLDKRWVVQQFRVVHEDSERPPFSEKRRQRSPMSRLDTNGRSIRTDVTVAAVANVRQLK